jgi:peptidoglycan/xylan/chitin deacetylase (PgdA/CDA1 family)
MRKKTRAGRTSLFRLGLIRLGWILLGVAFLGGCAAPKTEAPPVAVSPAPSPPVPPSPVELKASTEFVAITSQEGNTFSSLAAKYLNDPSLDWWIADFNNLSELHPGQSLIIPLKPYERGGLSLKGYQTVPVLSYHNFSADRSPNRMTVTKAAFEDQMRLLKEKGYRVITMDQLLDFLNFKAQIPKKSVVITIDDGWRSAYEIALPILKKYGYPATLFVYTGLIVGSGKTLSWELVREMAESGIDIQGHTVTHRILTSVNKKESFKEYVDATEKELAESARILKARVGKEIKYLAYPDGETNHLVISLVRKDGYQGAFTVKRGGNPFFAHNYRINRSMIYGDYDLNQFEKNLTVFSEWAGR